MEITLIFVSISGLCPNILSLIDNMRTHCQVIFEVSFKNDSSV